jgi:hypothetical protein
MRNGMIAVSDLRIGNWVHDSECTRYPMYVMGIGDDYVYLNFDGNEGDVWECDPDELQGIPVTIELLKKIGFEEDTAIVKFYRYWDKDYRYKLDVDEGYTNSGCKWSVHIDNGDCCTIGSGEFTYLHELQNLVSAIAKEELEVKLW